MVRSFTKFVLLLGAVSLVFSCTSNEVEYTFDKTPLTSVESKDGNVTVHFKDYTTQSFSPAQVETLLKERKIEENVYQLFTQKTKEAALLRQQLKPTGKLKKTYPYKLNGRDVHYVESKNGKFIIHMADKASHTFLQHELDCMLINHFITDELYQKCMIEKLEDEVSHKNPDSLGFSFSYRKIECPEFN